MSSSGFAVQAVSDLEVSKTRGLRCPRFTELEAPRALLGSLAPKLSGVEVLEALWGVGVEALESRCLGPFGVLGIDIPGRRLSTFYRASSAESPGPRCRSPSGLSVPRLSSRGVEGSSESLVSWASSSHGVDGFQRARGLEGSSESEVPSAWNVRHQRGSKSKYREGSKARAGSQSRRRDSGIPGCQYTRGGP